MNSAVRVFVFIVTFFTFQSTVAADSVDATVINPATAFGYTLGDVLEQKIALSINDTVQNLQSLPDEQRAGRWVTRSAVTISNDKLWLSIQYQIINAPPDVRVVTLPALTLTTDNGLSIDVLAWPFSIAPLLPAATDINAQLPVLQPDELAHIPPSSPLWRNISTLAIALFAWLSLWLAWWLWRNWREARALPFANAYQVVRHLTHDNDVNNNEGWLAMHKAFNQSAGRSVVNNTVNELCRNCHWLEPFESEIQTFFTLSSTRFFAPDSQHQPFDLNDFSKRLYQAEKRYTTSITTASSPSAQSTDHNNQSTMKSTDPSATQTNQRNTAENSAQSAPQSTS